jgi:hypothetical protein
MAGTRRTSKQPAGLRGELSGSAWVRRRGWSAICPRDVRVPRPRSGGSATANGSTVDGLAGWSNRPGRTPTARRAAVPHRHRFGTFMQRLQRSRTSRDADRPELLLNVWKVRLTGTAPRTWAAISGPDATASDIWHYNPRSERSFGPVGMCGFDRAWLPGNASRGCCSGLVNQAAKRSTWQPPVDSRPRCVSS